MSEGYSNQQLFERILENQMENQKESQDLRLEMEKTRTMIKKYNGIPEKMEEMEGEIRGVKNEVRNMKERKKGSVSVWEGILKWATLFVAVFSGGVGVAALFVKILD